MKLSRRCFLSLSIGGAVGTALTPLPWKLTDDLSIWSQNWAWTPVPADGASNYLNSTCALCPNRCGIRVRKVDERAVKIEGQNGGLCPLGLSGLQLLYAPWRVPGPLKRAGARGEGRWEAISWPEAVEEVASRLAALRLQGKSHTVAAVAPADAGTVPRLLERLLTAYGSPNFVRLPSVQDTYEAVLALTQGIKGFAGLDVENTDFILSFGSALLDGYAAPSRMMQALGRLKEHGGTLVQIEQRLSNTAAKADIWLTPRPGSEAHLALAMACAIIDQKRFQADFVATYTEGFQAFASMVKQHYSPAAAADVTGIPAETIVRTALAFAEAKRPLAVYGRGKGCTPGSLKEALSVHVLNALAGSINRPGGIQAMPAYDYLDWPELFPDAVAAAGLKSPRLDGGGAPYPLARHRVHHLFDAALKGQGELQALLVAEANPCHDLPGADRIRKAFDQIPLIVSFSSFMDETALQADLILPNHVYLERFEDLPVLAGPARSRIGLCQPVVAPLLNTQHLGDTLIQVARALEGPVADAFPWADYESCLQETLGDQWDGMIDKGFWEAEAGSGFGAGSGRFTFMNEKLAAVYKADPPAPAGDSGFPLVLLPQESIRLAGPNGGTPPFMLKILPDTALKGRQGVVEINPQTAAPMGLAEGRLAVLSTPVASAQVRIHLDEGVMPGILSMPAGLGHTALGPFLAGKGVNINQLIAPVEDPVSGLDAAWGIRAKLTQA